MNKTKKIIIGLGMLLFLSNIIFAEEQIVIESKLFRGVNQAINDYPQEIIVSSFSTPIFVPEISKNAELRSGSITSLKNELNKVFQIQHIDHLISGNMIWNGKKGILEETFSFDEFSYPIQFSPQFISKDSVNLKIEMFRESNINVTRKGGKVEKLLDTEIVVNFDKPIIFGFPINGNTYFLSINFARGSSGDLLSGEVIEVPSSTPLMMPPRPVYKFNPVYPIDCRNKQIEGKVILEVSTDIKGLVNKVRVLKSAHPSLDQAAVLTLKQWKFESVRLDEKPIPVVFAVSVDFKLRKLSTGQSLENNSIELDELGTILKKCAEYCERLENLSLYFVCEEAITEEISQRNLSLPAVERNKYIYDYQLIRLGNTIEERRILLKENGQKKNIVDAQLQTKRFHHKHILFGPIGLLGKKQQKNYEYKILKEVIYKKEKALILEVTPKFPEESDALYGKIWIRKKDFAILKIEWQQESLENFEGIEKIAAEFKAKPEVSFVSEYEFEENQIRFPNKYTVREVYILPKGTRYTYSEITVDYDNYKFFTVGTKVKY